MGLACFMHKRQDKGVKSIHDIIPTLFVHIFLKLHCCIIITLYIGHDNLHAYSTELFELSIFISRYNCMQEKM